MDSEMDVETMWSHISCDNENYKRACTLNERTQAPKVNLHLGGLRSYLNRSSLNMHYGKTTNRTGLQLLIAYTPGRRTIHPNVSIRQ